MYFCNKIELLNHYININLFIFAINGQLNSTIYDKTVNFLLAPMSAVFKCSF